MPHYKTQKPSFTSLYCLVNKIDKLKDIAASTIEDPDTVQKMQDLHVECSNLMRAVQEFTLDRNFDNDDSYEDEF